ncbi:MAG: hypothetical protein HQK76_14095 [Desulfobacterales bacterium]|nr:hypothetical protein [Desulfobacterales bacterium]
MKKMIILTIALFSFYSKAYALTWEEIYNAYKSSYDYEKMYRYEDSIIAISSVYKEYETGYTINLRLGWLYYLKGDYANSKFHYQNAMKVYPYYIEAKIGYMLPLMAQQKYSEVEEMAYNVLKTDYYNYYANYRLALALRYQEKYELAEAIVSKILYLYPTDTLFLTELALIKELQEDKEKASEIFKSIITLDPNNQIALKYLYKK